MYFAAQIVPSEPWRAGELSTRDNVRLHSRSPSHNATTTGPVGLAVGKSRWHIEAHFGRPPPFRKSERNVPSRKSGRPDQQNCLRGLVLLRLTNPTLPCAQRCREYPGWPAIVCRSRLPTVRELAAVLRRLLWRKRGPSGTMIVRLYADPDRPDTVREPDRGRASHRIVSSVLERKARKAKAAGQDPQCCPAMLCR